MNKYNSGDVPKVEWMDEKLIRYINDLRQNEELVDGLDYLYVQCPIFDFPVVFNEIVK
jgi:hypothetical protein